MAGLEISISGGGALDRVIGALSETGSSLPGEIFGAIEQETLKLIERAREAVVAMPTHGDKHTGLLQKVADGVALAQIITEDEQYLRVITQVPEADMRGIPRGLDAGEWSHPLFGNRNHWYTQHGAYSWFTQTFSDGKSEYMREVNKVLEAAAGRIKAAAS